MIRSTLNPTYWYYWVQQRAEVTDRLGTTVYWKTIHHGFSQDRATSRDIARTITAAYRNETPDTKVLSLMATGRDGVPNAHR